MKHSTGFLYLRLILCVLLALPIQVLLRMNGNDVSIANAQSSSTQVKYKPLEYFVSGKRINISAEVTDREGVKLARCYFRQKNVPSNDYYFVGLQMKAGEKNVYQGILPTPLQKIQEMEYLFLIVNKRNQIVKTETFSVKQKETVGVPSWQTANMDGQIQISTEIGQVLTAPEGFEENAIVDIIDTSQRFGIIAGLYGVAQAAMAGGITGDAAVATNLGDIKADTGGISWWWAAGGVAVIAAIAAAAGGGGGGGGGGSSTPTPTPTRFVNNGNGTVTDTQTGLMWADRDNGYDINWYNAKSYCEGYNRGGVSGWRMPTISELQGLYNAGAFGSVIGKTDNDIWSSETSGTGVAFFDFYDGVKIWSPQSRSDPTRALPVRSGR